MSLIVKIMSDEDLPDTDLTKSFRLVLAPDGTSINFIRNPDDEAVIIVTSPATRERQFMTETYPQPGNAYVINEQGKTIAVRNNKSQIVPVPKNAKEALKLGRSGKRAAPGTTAELARLQNMAAAAAHADESKYIISCRKPENAVEAFHFGSLGQVAPKGTLETLAIIQNHTAMETLTGIAPVKAEASPLPVVPQPQPHDNLVRAFQPTPNSRAYPPRPTASLAVGPRGKDSPNFDKGNKHG